MSIPNEHSNRFFYHFTHVDNIESIVKNGLLSTNEKARKKFNHINLANESIQIRRSQMKVPCSPYETIHDYVPFYFSTINPMLLGVLNKKNIDQPYVVFIALSVNKLLENNVIFTDASANTAIPPNFYKNPKDLVKLNWNLIDNQKWGRGTDEELHKRMAEVLVFKHVPIEWIDSYIVYNKICKKKINDIYTCNGLSKPKISYQPFHGKYFYFTKYFIKERKNETLITGPCLLESYFSDAVKSILEYRKKADLSKGVFKDVRDALHKISVNFCVIKELNDIFELQTDNKVHMMSVSDHTLQVVKYLDNIMYYKNLNQKDQELVKLSAYFHDIGKGPKSKWENGIQRAYSDHPADAVPMIMRILTEEFEALTEYEIRKICLLVIYHDIIGDIISNGRSEKELAKLYIDEKELYMLISISVADVSAINLSWKINLCSEIPSFINRAKKEICT